MRKEIDRVLEASPMLIGVVSSLCHVTVVLRCPSEVLFLRWQDFDWATGRIVVTSPKTEHHAGKAQRTIPLFSELRPFLTEAFEIAPVGAIYVVDERFRKGAIGPNGWQNANLRASRETELVELYPVQAVTGWLGNSPSVAMRHYLMTTDEHFQSATEGEQNITTPKALQKAAQSVHETPRNSQQVNTPAQEKTPVLQGLACSCESLQVQGIAGTGFEPATSRL